MKIKNNIGFAEARIVYFAGGETPSYEPEPSYDLKLNDKSKDWVKQGLDKTDKETFSDEKITLEETKKILTSAKDKNWSKDANAGDTAALQAALKHIHETTNANCDPGNLDAMMAKGKGQGETKTALKNFQTWYNSQKKNEEKQIKIDGEPGPESVRAILKILEGAPSTEEPQKPEAEKPEPAIKLAKDVPEKVKAALAKKTPESMLQDTQLTFAVGSIAFFKENGKIFYRDSSNNDQIWGNLEEEDAKYIFVFNDKQMVPVEEKIDLVTPLFIEKNGKRAFEANGKECKKEGEWYMTEDVWTEGKLLFKVIKGEIQPKDQIEPAKPTEPTEVIGPFDTIKPGASDTPTETTETEKNHEWLDAISQKTELKKQIPELFDTSNNIIQDEDPTASYKFIERKKDGAVLVEYDNNKNNVADGVDVIKNGKIVRDKKPIQEKEIVATLEYDKADIALKTLEKYKLFTKKEIKQLQELSQKYPDEKSRDFNFYKTLADTIAKGLETTSQAIYVEAGLKRYNEALKGMETFSNEEIKSYLLYDGLKALPKESPFRDKKTFKIAASKAGMEIKDLDDFIKKIDKFLEGRKQPEKPEESQQEHTEGVEGMKAAERLGYKHINATTLQLPEKFKNEENNQAYLNLKPPDKQIISYKTEGDDTLIMTTEYEENDAMKTHEYKLKIEDNAIKALEPESTNWKTLITQNKEQINKPEEVSNSTEKIEEKITLKNIIKISDDSGWSADAITIPASFKEQYKAAAKAGYTLKTGMSKSNDITVLNSEGEKIETVYASFNDDWIKEILDIIEIDQKKQQKK